MSDLSPAHAPTFDLRAFGKRMVEMGIRAAENADDMRERINIAHRDGHLTDEETVVWLTLQELERSDDAE